MAVSSIEGVHWLVVGVFDALWVGQQEVLCSDLI